LSFSNFELGPEDLIGVTVLDAPEFSRQVRVSGDGKIRLPLIKMPIEAGGKTSSQLEQSIAQALVDDGLLVEPAVSVTMLEFNSKPVSISGAVRSPTVFQAIRPLTVGEAISRAGGLSESAGTDIVITIPARNENNAQTVHVPVKALQETDPKESKLLLRGGEEVTVSTAGQVYMLGGVAKPGAVLLNTEEPLTLLKALALSGGTTPGTGSKAFLLRAGAGGQKEEIMLNLNKLMKRQAPDLPLQTNDVVFIPDSKSRKLGQAGMNAAVSSFMYTIAGALILR
jgi:polysaccharide export outer membrane protein